MYVSEKLEIRYGQLKSDLFRPNNTMFDVFDLVQELRDGTERHFIIKKFFWKVRGGVLHALAKGGGGTLVHVPRRRTGKIFKSSRLCPWTPLGGFCPQTPCFVPP